MLWCNKLVLINFRA